LDFFRNAVLMHMVVRQGQFPLHPGQPPSLLVFVALSPRLRGWETLIVAFSKTSSSMHSNVVCPMAMACFHHDVPRKYLHFRKLFQQLSLETMALRCWTLSILVIAPIAPTTSRCNSSFYLYMVNRSCLLSFGFSH
jgi:hypothetical protein